jgi:hypothetical protein
MILPVTVPVTVACLTVTVSGRSGHDSSFTVTVTQRSFTVTLSDLRVSQSRPRLGAPGRPAPRPLLGSSAPAALAGRGWPDVGWRQAHGTAASSSLSRSSDGRIEKHLPCLVCGVHWQPQAASRQ